MKRSILVFLLTAAIGFLHAGDLKKLSVEQVIYGKGEKLYKSLPNISGWADDTHYYQYSDSKLLKVHVRTGKETLMLDYSKNEELEKHEFKLRKADDRTADFNTFLFVKEGAFYLFNRLDQKLTELGSISENAYSIKNPTLSPDGLKIAYTKKGDLFVFNTVAKKETRFTTDGSDIIFNGYASWVYYEEILGRRSRYKAFWWSPDSSRIVFMRFDQEKVPVFTLFRAKGDYGSLEQTRYPKPGYPNPTVKLAVALLKSGSVNWIDYNDPNEHYLAFPKWNKNASKIFFQWMNRDQDHIKIYCYETASGKLEQVYEEKQPTWVEFFEGGDFYILKNDDLLIRSSRDGWYHIYYISQKTGMRQITSGEWTVNGIERIDEKRKIIYFGARKEDSTQYDFYRTGFDGKKIKRLTQFPGSHSVTVSPKGRYFIDRYSSLSTPTRIDIRDNRGRLVRKVADSYSPVIEQYKLAKPELFRVKTDDGYHLPVTWTLPPDLDKTGKTRKYPVVFIIYGGPGASSVRNSYGRGTERFFLAQEGIISVSADHRGSGHFGKKGIDLMHRQLGKWEMHDYIQVINHLKTLPFVDGEKIGITGGSYGGYIAAYALTHSAGHFGCGISGAPVMDWRLYDSVYTERYMDTPQQNPEGYKSSSVFTYIDNLKGKLRLTHGAMDDNVHPQNSLQFLDKALDRGYFIEFMLYPGNRHGIRGDKGKTDRKHDLDFWFRHFFGRTLK